ncbi:MAG TPA: apolipoprotein N-acyltransferase [Bryobacteraceae bacterium]|nr:apolipoprotein N-acyltransferase [Bryobacteraceae bacterium]
MLNLFLALASGALLALVFPRYNLVWLAPAALTPMLVALAREPRPWRRFVLGWSAGLVYWLAVCYWIQWVLADYAGVGQAGGWALFALFCVAKSIHMGVFAAAAGILMRRWWAVPAVAALWTAIEATHGFFGFAWLALGNIAIDMSVPLRLAPITGVWGISFVLAMMSTALALALLRRPRVQLAWLLLLPFLGFLPPLPPALRGQQTALLLQSNVSETADWTPESLDRGEQEQLSLTLRSAMAQVAHPPSIIVWPEVPAPFYYFDDPHFRAYIDNLARTTRAYLLIGTVAHTPEGGPLNSAVLVSPAGTPISRYDKVNLVPFGEFVPWPFRAIVKQISTEAGDFQPGRRIVVSPADGHKIGTFICYESVFPNFVRQFAANGAEVLFNISNDGWFGKSAARYQHLLIVRMRAAENRRWILRATNDGITATIDSAGRVRGQLPMYEQAASYTGFNYEAQQTFYTRHGDWFPWLCGVLAALCLLAATIPAYRLGNGRRTP